MPRTGLNGEELKERAIDAALCRMRLVGYDKVRLIDVAKDIGVSHATLYQHFADKAALLDAVTERWMSEIEQAVSDVAGSDGNPKTRILEWFVVLYKLKRAKSLDDPAPHQAFDVASAHEKAFVIAHLANLIDQLTDLFTELGANSAYGDPNSNAKLMYRATAAFHHPTMIAQLAKEDREQELRQIVQLLFSGMGIA